MSGEQWTERPRIVRALHPEAGIRLHIVKAPHGYGKSVALRQLRASLGTRARMLTLTERHGDPQHLQHSLDEMLVGLDGAESRVVILDEYDAIAVFPLANEALEQFVLSLPAQVSVVLATRMRPRFALGFLRGARALRELTYRDLAFEPAELTSLVRECWRLPATDQQLARLSRLSEGWATGAALLADGIEHNPEDDAELLWPVFEYFTELAGRHLTPAALSFAMRNSILDELHAEVAVASEGEDGPLTTLRTLADASMFTAPLTPGSSRFRFHPLFQAFLTDRLTYSHSAEEIADLHEQAAAALAASGETSAALLHLLKAGQFGRAAGLLTRVGIGQLDFPALSAIETELNRAPGNVMRENPWLLALLGRLRRLRHDYDGALAALVVADADFELHGDKEARAWVSTEISQVNYRDEFYDGAAARVRQDLESPTLSTLTHANLSAHLCWILCETGPVGEAIEAGQTSLSKGTMVDDAYLRGRVLLRAHRNLALASIYAGDLDRAVALIEHARIAGGDVLEVGWSNVIYGMSLALRGARQRAQEIFAELAETVSPYNSTQLRWVHWWLGNLLRADGQTTAARTHYRQAGSLALIDEALMNPTETGMHSFAAAADRVGHVDRRSQSALRRAGAALVRSVTGMEDEPARCLADLAKTSATLMESGHRLHATSINAYRSRAELRFGSPNAGERLHDDVIGFMLHNRIEALPWGVHRRPDGQLLFPDREPTDGDMLPDVIESCADPAIRARLTTAHGEGVITSELLTVLRERGLTWREVDVFVVYYLRSGGSLGEGTSLRDRTARMLRISEHTLKTHITRIRTKLDLPEHRGGTSDLDIRASTLLTP